MGSVFGCGCNSIEQNGSHAVRVSESLPRPHRMPWSHVLPQRVADPHVRPQLPLL